jgi:hypothetical protein
VEAVVATTIVGLGISALLVSVESGTRINDAGKKLTEAAFLAQGIREWTLQLPFSDPDPNDATNPPGPDGSDPQTFVDDLDDFLNFDLQGITYDPPRDGGGYQIYGMDGWSQTIDLTWRNANDLSQVVTDGSSDVIYVEVGVVYQGIEELNTGWIVTRKED